MSTRNPARAGAVCAAVPSPVSNLTFNLGWQWPELNEIRTIQWHYCVDFRLIPVSKTAARDHICTSGLVSPYFSRRICGVHMGLCSPAISKCEMGKSPSIREETDCSVLVCRSCNTLPCSPSSLSVRRNVQKMMEDSGDAYIAFKITNFGIGKQNWVERRMY